MRLPHAIRVARKCGPERASYELWLLNSVVFGKSSPGTVVLQEVWDRTERLRQERRTRRNWMVQRILPGLAIVLAAVGNWLFSLRLLVHRRCSGGREICSLDSDSTAKSPSIK